MPTILLKILIALLNFVYFFMKLLPTQNKVVMISRQTNEIPQDFALLGKKLKRKHKVVYLCKTLDGGAKATFKTRLLYGLHMFTQMYHLATSRVCLLDSYSPAVSVLKHKKSLTIIQLWHSIGTMKKFGYTSLGKDEGSNDKVALAMKMHKNYSFAICSGKAYRPHLASGFGIPESDIKIFTLPRVDLLKDKKYAEKMRQKIYKKYPGLKKKKTVLYAPTFRKNEKDFKKAAQDLIDNFDFKNYNLVIKLHPLSKAKIKSKNAIIDRDFSTFDMLFVADKMISDYSCIVYEAGVRNIPLYFYNFDFDKYQVARGLALNYSELPGFTSPKAKDLIKSLDKPYDKPAERAFIKKYVENQNNCTKSLVAEIEKYLSR